MEHQANERIEHGLKRRKGRQSPIKHRASIRKRLRNDHIGDHRSLHLKIANATQQNRHAQQAQNFKSDRLLGLGMLLGGVQQLRGAHFLTHTLWTAWIACAVAGLLYALLVIGAVRRGSTTT